MERFDDPRIGSTGMTVRHNRIVRSGSTGIETFGIDTLIEENVLIDACYSKGDCGGIGCFTSENSTVRRNIVQNVISPVEGFSGSFRERFGFGLCIDVESTANCSDNTIVNTQGYGIIYQSEAVGDVTGNTVYGNQGRVHVFCGSSGTISHLTGNIFVGIEPIRLMFTEADGRILASDNNYFIQPHTEEYISMQSAEWVRMNLAEWQSFSGQDQNSLAAWFTLAEGAAPITEIFVNDTEAEQTIALTGTYVDLDQQAVGTSITLAPFTSRVVVAQ